MFLISCPHAPSWEREILNWLGRGLGTMLKSDKEAVVESLADMFSKANGIYLTNYKGMDVASVTELRGRLGGASASYRVV
ncbi:MAG: 50S ribosomal protein L10, partial [Candidatus Latescibacteria bacterium]|nr:50S ribosomal protein L10 [Candidatus Latescibacterota bacterium]